MNDFWGFLNKETLHNITNISFIKIEDQAALGLIGSNVQGKDNTLKYDIYANELYTRVTLDNEGILVMYLDSSKAKIYSFKTGKTEQQSEFIIDINQEYTEEFIFQQSTVNDIPSADTIVIILSIMKHINERFKYFNMQSLPTNF